jgi:hypothetical protein
MQFLCSTAFRKHMIVSSVAILAIFSSYPSAADPISITLNRPLQPASLFDTIVQKSNFTPAIIGLNQRYFSYSGTLVSQR